MWTDNGKSPNAAADVSASTNYDGESTNYNLPRTKLAYTDSSIYTSTTCRHCSRTSGCTGKYHHVGKSIRTCNPNICALNLKCNAIPEWYTERNYYCYDHSFSTSSPIHSSAAVSVETTSSPNEQEFTERCFIHLGPTIHQPNMQQQIEDLQNQVRYLSSVYQPIRRHRLPHQRRPQSLVSYPKNRPFLHLSSSPLCTSKGKNWKKGETITQHREEWWYGNYEYQTYCPSLNRRWGHSQIGLKLRDIKVMHLHREWFFKQWHH